MDLVAGAIQKASIDEHDPVPRGVDASGEIGARPPFLVHDAHLDRVGRQPENLLDVAEHVDGKGDLLWPVHLRLYDIDAAHAAVADVVVIGHRGSQVVNGDQRRDGRIEHALRHVVALGRLHGVGVHVMTHVAHQHQAAPRQRQRAAIGRGVAPVGVEPPGHGAAALVERGTERAGHETEPIAIHLDLVGRIDGGDAVLQVLDRADGAFEYQVRHAGRIVGADRVSAVDLDLGMQPMIGEQDGRWGRRIAPVADELRRRSQQRVPATGHLNLQVLIHNSVAGRVGMRPLDQRCHQVEHLLGPGDDGRTPLLVVARPPRADAVGQGVGAIQGVVKAAPARIGGVERIAGVHDRHDQLRPGDRRDLGVYILGLDRKRLGFG